MATSANVTAGKPKTTGAIFVGATSLTMPTNATTALRGRSDQCEFQKR